MKYKVIGKFQYFADGLTLSYFSGGEVVDMSPSFAAQFLRAGVISPIEDRETKPLREAIEIKSNNPAKRRTRKPSRAKVKPTDNLDS